MDDQWQRTCRAVLHPTCEAYTPQPCSAPADWAIRYNVSCPHFPEVKTFCQPHASMVAGTWKPPYDYGECTVCQAPIRFLTMAPVGVSA